MVCVKNSIGGNRVAFIDINVKIQRTTHGGMMK